MPCRVSFKVASGMDSRIVLDQKGAELLLGQGDMLFLSPQTHRASSRPGHAGRRRRDPQGRASSSRPSRRRPSSAASITIRPGGGDDEEELSGKIAERDPLFDQAVEIIIESGRGSVSLLQRRLAIGYSRASRLVDQMGLAGILGDHKGSVARDVLITMDEWKQMKAMEEEAEREGSLFEGPSDDSAEGLAVPAEYDEEYLQ